jgi:hypothetical protein
MQCKVPATYKGKFRSSFLCAPNMCQEDVDGRLYHLHLSSGLLVLWSMSGTGNAQLGACERFG